MLRNQTRGQENLSLADFIAPKGDWIGCFAVTAGIGLKELCEKFRAAGDDYNAIMAKLLADRLTEAFAEAVHSFVRRQMWGYETGEAPTPRQVIRGEYRGRRMAFGYPASPDHSLKREVFDLLAAELTTGMKLTEITWSIPGRHSADCCWPTRTTSRSARSTPNNCSTMPGASGLMSNWSKNSYRIISKTP